MELLTDRLHDAGYAVAYDGVWHVLRHESDDRTGEYAHFQQRSFPYQEYAAAAERAGQDPARSRAPVRTPSDEGIQDWSFSVPRPLALTGDEHQHPDRQCAHSVAEFIRNHATDGPFAAWASFGAPHPPLLVPEAFFGRHSPAEVAPPVGLFESADGRPRAATSDAPGFQSVQGWGWDDWARAIAGYYDYTAFADDCMRIVLDALDEAGCADNTLVIATGDHGEMLGAHNLYQKGVLYEPACCLAAVVRGPGVPAGTSDRLLSHVDLAPSVLNYCGLPALAQAEGSSFLDSETGIAGEARDFLCLEFNGYIKGGNHMRGVVSDRYKYIFYRNGEQELFDLEADPDECRNLVADEALAAVLQQHRDALAEWMNQTDDFLEDEFRDAVP
jgi:arylsulfatase A-like enzyme